MIVAREYGKPLKVQAETFSFPLQLHRLMPINILYDAP